MEDVRTSRGVDAASDHHLLVGKFKLRLKIHNCTKRQSKIQHCIPQQHPMTKEFKDNFSRKNTELQLKRREG